MVDLGIFQVTAAAIVAVVNSSVYQIAAVVMDDSDIFQLAVVIMIDSSIFRFTAVNWLYFRL